MLLLGGPLAGPAVAHPEAPAPSNDVVPPDGERSAGVPQVAVSRQVPGEVGTAQTPDGQAQLTLLEGALPRTGDGASVEVRLEPVDPATLPPLPGGLAPEGNAYRVVATASGQALTAFGGRTVLTLTAAGPPSAAFSLVDGAWVPATAAAYDEEGIGTIFELDAPGTYLQAYAPVPGSSRGPALVAAAVGVPLLLVGLLTVAARSRRARSGRTGQAGPGTRSPSGVRGPGMPRKR